MIDERLNDKSFQEKENVFTLLFGGIKYTQSQVRDIWFRGKEVGIEIGLRKASLEGQRIELDSNTLDPKHREFLEKFYKLAAEYQCAIQYHPEHGMVVIHRKNTFQIKNNHGK